MPFKSKFCSFGASISNRAPALKSGGVTLIKLIFPNSAAICFDSKSVFSAKPSFGSVRPSAGGILPSIGDGLAKVFGGLFSGGKKNTTAKTNTNAANSGKTQTGNPSVPKTGGGAAVSLFVLAATAGIAAGAVLLKKKTDSDQD